MDYLIFEDKEYPVKNIWLSEFENVNISTIDLNYQIVNENGGYKNFEAEIIDEHVFYFVSNEEILLECEDLAKLVLENI
jgi:hypothetical protein